MLTMTVEEVQALTGGTVTPEDVTLAVSVIETTTGVDLSPDPLPYRVSDVRHLRRAVAWQARYLAEHPDLIEREAGLASASTNGNAMSWTNGSGGTETLLSPLARMALRRVSWRRTRSVSMRRAKPAFAAQTLLVDGSDGEWQPLR